MRNLLLASLSVGCSLLVVTTANARPARVDLANNPSADYSGEYWTSDNITNFSPPPSAGFFQTVSPDSVAQGVDLFLKINAGAAVEFDYCFAANGYLSVGGSCGSTAPTQDFIKVFTPELAWTSMEWSPGTLDTETNGGDPGYSALDAVKAVRFTWRAPGTIAQVVLIDRSNGTDNGDFDLEYNYGLFGSANAALAGSIGYSLGGQVLNLTDDNGNRSFTCQFRGGVSDGCGLAPVPVPAPALLLGSGIAALWRFQRRRKLEATSAA